MTGPEAVPFRVRLRFTKLGKVRFTSHRDVARMWERALRLARLPIAYTAGFSPRPQLAFGLALPTGCESVAEYLDVAFRQPVEVDALTATLTPLLPDGVDVVAAAPVDRTGGSLQELVDGCSWEIEVPGHSPGEIEAAVAGALEATQLPIRRERKGRVEVDDLRPSLLALDARPGSDGALLLAELATRPRGVRPGELSAVLGLPLGRARRTSQWIERGGARREPLTAPADVAGPAVERVS